MKENYISTADLARILGITRQAIQKQLKGQTGIVIKEVGSGFLYDVATLPKELQGKIETAQKDASKTLQTLKPKNNKDLSFEKELWSAADRLRGNIDAGEYKHIVLGLLFLKYISDAFNQRRVELETKTTDSKNKEFYISDQKARVSFIDDKNSYLGVGVFFVPKKARWDYLRDRAMQPTIGKIIEEAMDAIEAENQKQLRGVLPKDRYLRTALEPQALGELVNIFSKISFDHDFDKEKDILGRVYEYFLGEFASAEGKRGGEFFTPRSIVQLIVEILEPYENARILDPAAGSGGMFVQSTRFLKAHKKDPSHIGFYGQESNPTTFKLCKMNLALRGIFGNIEVGNSYYDDKFPDLRADFVIANPPFNAEWDPKRLSDKDPRTAYGTPPSSNANFMWIQHFAHHLAPSGMAGFVMANGALAVGGREGEIRKKIIEADLVDIIVACPPKLFYNVGLPVSIWFLSKNKSKDRFRKRGGETLFIDAREIFEQISRKQVRFTEEHIEKIAGTVRAWRGEDGKYMDMAGFCKTVTKEDIVKNGYVLTPGRYVGVADEVDDGVPFDEKMKKLEGELKQYFKYGEKIQENILENIKKLKN
ncbi:MAG: class I SAM-dependent DNA methyltransferase [bacterium]|nr:class I SAM-dependent DNA methyltransferase [bacterium]